ncbi:thioredoxin domain-containing protein [Ketobacter sp.]|uniref:thioredoxin domain-containing protein n=1 Tax=Ketobacter sp. TaxID=2083498 RepID=UPI000F1DCA05|nr:thioredoxin domain-containing protein [Ketobacter sp.]RLU00939.1 MAG: thioredoxin domain-containing protein [Ketobacter sp.]
MIRSIGLQAAQEQKRGQYDIRTRHRDADGNPRFVNHLIRESSPYLLQHAHNPVKWRSWDAGALQLAKEQNKPVFLSVGYSTCHWCHVMEEESFDDLQVAEHLNRNFIAIKLDREQRPDLDELYMTALQIIRGSGGWPMSLFLTPQGAPFFGGTYYNKAQFIEVLQQVHLLWQEEQAELMQQADQLLAQVKGYLEPVLKPQQPDPQLPEMLSQHLLKLQDQEHGGFGQAPKFPQEPYLLFLLDQVARDVQCPLPHNPLWRMLSGALDAMLQGGLYDQVGGGFHRYAVDPGWQVPHFEKMLYNQAQLVRVYAQAFALSGNPEYRRLAVETLAYVSTEMRDAQGLFFSASDADSEGEEGLFYIWRHTELKMLLEPAEFELLTRCYAITEQGNFEGRLVLNLQSDLRACADRLQVPYPELVERLARIRQILYRHRALRQPPLTDHKVITEWNSMMIAAYAEAARLLDEPDYYDIARQAATTLLAVHRRESGALWRLSLGGQGSEEALLEDYAHLLDALLRLYDVAQDPQWLQQAMTLYCALMEQYWDKEQGGFFVSGKQVSGPLPVRSKNVADSATVCGNGLMLTVLQELQDRTGEWLLRDKINTQLRTFAASVNQAPLSSPMLVKGIVHRQQGSAQGLQYGAGGALWARLQWRGVQANGEQRLQLTIRGRSPFYIDPRQVTAVHYGSDQRPEAIPLSLGNTVNDPAATVWEWTWTLSLPHTQGAGLKVGVTVRACNADRCHTPEQLVLVCWPLADP